MPRLAGAAGDFVGQQGHGEPQCARRKEGGRLLSAEGRRVEVPTGCAVFPAEMLSWPPRSYVERVYNVTHWTEMPRGGHFAAMEQPELLVEDIRTFARTLR